MSLFYRSIGVVLGLSYIVALEKCSNTERLCSQVALSAQTHWGRAWRRKLAVGCDSGLGPGAKFGATYPIYLQHLRTLKAQITTALVCAVYLFWASERQWSVAGKAIHSSRSLLTIPSCNCGSPAGNDGDEKEQDTLVKHPFGF